MLPASADYSDKDFDALRVRMFKLITSVFPEWSDQNAANFGNILVELFAFVGDVLTYYMDNASAESRIVTATQRKSLLGLCKLVGFVPTGATASTATVVFSLPSPATANVVIRAGDVVTTADVTDVLKFQLLEDVTIPVGATSAQGVVENSSNATEVFQSTGLADIELTLSSLPYLDGSAQVIAADGAYVEVTNFINSTAGDKHFVVVVDQNDRARIRFGDGVTGSVPRGAITCAYKTGGGSGGKVEPGAIKVLTRAYVNASGVPVQLSCINPGAAVGGADRMTNAQIKVLAPQSIRAPVNTIAREDFSINAERLPQVARAMLLTSDEDPAVPENTGHLFIIPSDGGVPSQELKDLVHSQVTRVFPCAITFNVVELDPVYKAINVYTIVHRRAGYTKAQTKKEITDALTAFFVIKNPDGTRNERVDFGANLLDENGSPVEQLAWSDIFDVIRDLPSVRKVDSGPSGLLLNGERDDVSIASREFPQLGSITVVDGGSGEVI